MSSRNLKCRLANGLISTENAVGIMHEALPGDCRFRTHERSATLVQIIALSAVSLCFEANEVLDGVLDAVDSFWHRASSCPGPGFSLNVFIQSLMRAPGGCLL